MMLMVVVMDMLMVMLTMLMVVLAMGRADEDTTYFPYPPLAATTRP